ncbi:MAG: ATPase, T2SS/T4P/T4SS family [Myxococcota bacterium]
MNYRLSIERADGSVESRAVRFDQPVVVGRDPSCEVVLSSEEVSRRHVTLEKTAGGSFTVTDSSANGTVVDNQRIRRATAALSLGTPIRVGRYLLRLIPSTESVDAEAPTEVAISPLPAPLGVSGEARRQILSELSAKLDPRKAPEPIRVTELLSRIITNSRELARNVDRERLTEELAFEATGLGAIEPLLSDPHVSPIMIVGPDRIYVDRGGERVLAPYRYSDQAALELGVERLLAQATDSDTTGSAIETSLSDGTRLELLRPPVSRTLTLTLRRSPRRTPALAELVRSGALSDPMARLLRRGLRGGRTVLVSGGPDVDRASFVRTLAGELTDEQRLVVIGSEVSITQPHRIELPGALSDALVDRARRLRPDRLVVGTCRGPEAYELVQAMAGGSCLLAVVGDSPRHAVERLLSLALRRAPSLESLRAQLATGIDLVVQLRRSQRATVVEAVVEVIGTDASDLLLQPLFLRDPGGEGEPPVFRTTGYLPSFLGDLIQKGLVEAGGYL